jgi:LemA protein
MNNNALAPLRRLALAALALAATLGLGGCGYNDFQRLDEGVKAAWSEVLNQYQRRADLIRTWCPPSRAKPISSRRR